MIAERIVAREGTRLGLRTAPRRMALTGLGRGALPARGWRESACRRRQAQPVSAKDVLYAALNFAAGSAVILLAGIFVIGMALAVWAPFGDEAETVRTQMREVGYAVDSVRLVDADTAQNATRGARVYRVLYRDDNGIYRDGYRVVGEGVGLAAFAPSNVDAKIAPSTR